MLKIMSYIDITISWTGPFTEFVTMSATANMRVKIFNAFDDVEQKLCAGFGKNKYCGKGMFLAVEFKR